jgi:hypothetical protein
MSAETPGRRSPAGPPSCGAEAICEFGAVVGEDRVNLMLEVRQEAFQESGGRRAIAPLMHLDPCVQQTFVGAAKNGCLGQA